MQPAERHAALLIIVNFRSTQRSTKVIIFFSFYTAFLVVEKLLGNRNFPSKGSIYLTGEERLFFDLQIPEKPLITQTWQRHSEAKEITTVQLHFFYKTVIL